MTANELADELTKMFRGEEYDRLIHEIPDMLRQQQAEIKALKKHNEELQKACVETLVWVMGNGGYCSLDIEVILKNVLGSEWEDYK
jgi:hypothetical protein